MGCDIHCCIEYAEFRRPDERWEYTPFAWDLNLGRDYNLFALMAGVRAEEGIVPVCEPKGLPDDVSLCLVMRSGYQIDDELAALEAEGYCSREEAEKWVRSGHSEFIGEGVISDPDWHSVSWLDLGELEEVQRRYRLMCGSDHRELSAVIAAIRALSDEPGARSRLVFWFKG